MTTDQSVDAIPSGSGLGVHAGRPNSREHNNWDVSQLISDQDHDPLLSKVKAWVKK